MSVMTIWIDLSDAAPGPGPGDGIQRVLNGLATELPAATEHPVRFCRFDSTRHRFVVAPSPERPNSAERTDCPDTPAVSGTAPVSGTAAVSGTAVPAPAPAGPAVPTGALHQLQQTLRERAPALLAHPVTRLALHKVRAGTCWALHAFKEQRHQRALLKAEEVPFQGGDVLVVAGKPWDEPDRTPATVALRARHGLRLVCALYDLVIPLHPHLHHLELFGPYNRFLFEMVPHTDLFLTISDCTRRDLLAYCQRLHLPAPTVRVIRLGDEPPSWAAAQSEPVEGLTPGSFLLTVGTVEIRKNHQLLYTVYRRARELGVTLPPLVVAGRAGWKSEQTLHLLTHDPALAHHVLLVDAPTDAQLEWLYRNCRFCLYPSFYEGWGLPVAEAAARGKLTVASSAASVPEIAGDLLLYHSPYSVDECLDRVRELLDDTSLAEAEGRLLDGYTVTTWAQTAAQVAAAIGSTFDFSIVGDQP